MSKQLQAGMSNRREKQLESKRRLRAKRLAAGLCSKCDTPRTLHAYYCERHAKQVRDVTRKLDRRGMPESKIRHLDEMKAARERAS